MVGDKIVDSLMAALPEEIGEMPGGVWQSGFSTLRPADIYILGYNPGGSGGPETVEHSIKNLPGQGDNEYIVGEWGSYAAGEHPFQRRLRFLIEALGYDLQNLPGSNLIFPQSPTSQQMNHKYAALCWPLHEVYLEIIQPKMILTIGNGESKSAFAYLKSRYGAKQVERVASKVSGWGCKRFSAQINGKSVTVVGVPHVSRFDPARYSDLFDWIKQSIG